MKKRFGFFGILVAGIAGLVTGLLTAPKSGKETREDVKVKADEMKDRANKALDEAQTTASEKAHEVRGRADEVVAEAKRRAEEVKGEVKNRAEEVKEGVKSRLGQDEDVDSSDAARRRNSGQGTSSAHTSRRTNSSK